MTYPTDGFATYQRMIRFYIEENEYQPSWALFDLREVAVLWLGS